MAKSTIPNNGFWSTIAAIFNSMFDDLYDEPLYGWYDYNDLATQSTPITVPGTLTDVYLTNDGAGPNTNTTYGVDGIVPWNTSTNEFDFSLITLGDTIDIRLDLEVTTTAPNQLVEVNLELGSGDPSTYNILFNRSIFKSAGPNLVNRFNGIYIGNVLTRDNPGKFKIKSDGSCTVKVNGWYVRVVPRIRMF